MKLHYLDKAIDFKMETTTQIVRMGTPIKDLNAADLPQPSSEETNMSLLPHPGTKQGIQEKKHKSKPRTGHYINYLEQFHDENAVYADRQRRFFAEIEEHGKVVVNMRDMLDKATRFNQQHKTAKVQLTHMGVNRKNKEFDDLPKLEVLCGFAKLWGLITDESRWVVVNARQETYS